MLTAPSRNNQMPKKKYINLFTKQSDSYPFQTRRIKVTSSRGGRGGGGGGGKKKKEVIYTILKILKIKGQVNPLAFIFDHAP